MAPSDILSKAAKTLDPYGLFDSKPTFSHATTSTGPSRIIITAGQVGADENGIVPAVVEDQIELAFVNLRRCLEAAGAQVTDVLKLTYYIVNYDPKNRRHFKPLMKFLGGHRPATTLIAVPALAKPEFLFEVEATAAVREEPMRTCDVVVVGAGLSGLQAAVDVQQAGLSCVVLEARDRVGGKTWSIDNSGKGAGVDVGAAWINDSNQSKIFALAKRFGLKTIVQPTSGSVVQEDLDGSRTLFPYGKVPGRLAEKGGVENMVKIRDMIERLCQDLDISDTANSGKEFDKYTLEEFIKSKGAGPSAVASISVATRAMLGLEPSEVGALFFLNYCKSGGGLLQMRADVKHGGQHLRIDKGTQEFSKCLASELTSGSLILNCPVFSIAQDPSSGALVTAGTGQFRCQRVIVSIPTPLYKDIAFSPPLPADKAALGNATKLGYTTKVNLVFSEPWWRKAKLAGMAQSWVGPISVTRDVSVDEKGLYAMTCFLVGEAGRKWSELPEQAKKDAVVAQVKRMFSPFVSVPEPIDAIFHVWAEDQWSQGCPCPAMPAGVLSGLGHALRTSHGRVHFVGTETAFEWKGYMDGALRAGERGAKEVVQQHGRSKL